MTRAATCTCTSAAPAAPATGIDIVRIKQIGPERHQVSEPCFARPRGASSCHDNNVLMNVGGAEGRLRDVRGRQRPLAMYKFDMAKAGRRGRHAARARAASRTRPSIWAKRMPDEITNPAVTTGHSGSFTYDGKLLVYGHEPGGGTQSRAPG